MAKTDITYRASLDPQGVKEGANAVKGEFGKLSESFAGVAAACKRYNDTMAKGANGNIKKELRATTQAAVALEAEYRKLSDAEKASANGQALRAKIDELIQRGGTLKDTIADVGAAMGRVASDTAQLDVAVGALGALNAVVQVGVGAFSMLGVEEEKLASVQKNLMAVIAIGNGLQTIQNALQKESAVLMWANAVKTAVLSAATKGDTIIQTAWNVAKAVGKALLGDFTGLLIVGAGALATYAMTHEDAADAEEKEAEATKKANEAKKQEQEEIAKSLAEYQAMIAKVKAFHGSKKQEEALVKEVNQKYGDFTGKINSAAEAYTKLTKNAEKFVAQLKKEAEVRALMSKLVELYNEKITLESAPSKVAVPVQTTDGMGNIVTRYEMKDAPRADRRINELQNSIDALAKRMVGIYGTMDYSYGKGGGTSSSSSRSHTSKKSTEKVYEKGSIGELEKRIKELQEKKISVTTDKERIDLEKQIKSLEGQKFILEFTAKNGKTPMEAIREMMSKDMDSKPLPMPELKIDEEKIKDGMKNAIAYIDEWKEKVKEVKQETLYQSIDNLASAFSSLGEIIGGVAGKMVSWAAQSAASIAQMIADNAKLIVSAQAVSMANGAKSAFALPFPFNLAAWASVAATIAGIFASLPKFATGGIVGGTGFSGDHQLIRANSGEMVINRSQQAKLWSAISGGSIGGGQVVFKISGQELYGVLKNYNSKMSKVR